MKTQGLFDDSPVFYGPDAAKEALEHYGIVKEEKGKNYNTTHWPPRATTSLPKVSPCQHTVNNAVFKLGKITFYAANRNEIERSPGQVIIDCAGVAKTRDFVLEAFDDSILELNSLTVLKEKITLDWPDMSAPTQVGRTFWQQLYKRLEDLEVESVVVCCFGGHGRTGTCLAAFAICCADMTKTDAVDFVRKQHCFKAVESEAQHAYLRSLEKEGKS